MSVQQQLTQDRVITNPVASGDDVFGLDVQVVARGGDRVLDHLVVELVDAEVVDDAY